MNKIISGILILFIVSCKSVQIPSPDEAIIIMKKTPCFGTCPEYELMIFSDGLVVLDAKQNLGLKGKYRSALSKETYGMLIDAFNSHDFFGFENNYTSTIADLPTTFLTFRQGGNEKRVKDYYGAPDALKQLENEVHKLIDELTWEKIKSND